MQLFTARIILPWSTFIYIIDEEKITITKKTTSTFVIFSYEADRLGFGAELIYLFA